MRIVDFNPRFQVVTSFYECADLINHPHEDYPRRVPTTEKLIRERVEAGINEITAFDLRAIHSEVMWDMPVDRGRWRRGNVRVGDYRPPSWEHVGDLVDQIMPVGRSDSIASWYRAFQMVHPFRDGNGRVGGTVLAVLSHTRRYEGAAGDGSMLAPLQ